MKVICLLVSMTMSLSFFSQFVYVNDAVDMGCKGDVISFSETRFVHNKKQTHKFKSHFYFNDNNQLVNQVSLNDEEEKKYELTNEYQSNGLKSVTTSINYYSAGADTVTTKFNEYGQRECNCKGENESSTEFDSRGNVIKTFTKSGELYQEKEYKYENEKIVELTSKRFQGGKLELLAIINAFDKQVYEEYYFHRVEKNKTVLVTNSEYDVNGKLL